jgi:glycosyltransferase involved in cell wall biosynthesis
MDELYFTSFNIPLGKAREIRQKNWNINFETCDNIFTLSNWAMDANKKLHPEKAEKLSSIGWGPNIAPPARDEILNSSRQHRVICIGHDYYKKGVDIFNEVSRELGRRLPNLQCVIVGRSENGLDVSKLDSLTIYPPAAPEQVSLMMKTSKLFMILSRFEAAGHVTIEAMCHGLPVICSDVCGLPEPIVHGKTGYVVDVANIEDIVNKSYDLLTNDEKLETLRRNAYQHAMENWQWKNVAENVMTAYLSRP